MRREFTVRIFTTTEEIYEYIITAGHACTAARIAKQMFKMDGYGKKIHKVETFDGLTSFEGGV